MINFIGGLILSAVLAVVWVVFDSFQTEFIAGIYRYFEVFFLGGVLTGAIPLLLLMNRGSRNEQI